MDNKELEFELLTNTYNDMDELMDVCKEYGK